MQTESNAGSVCCHDDDDDKDDRAQQVGTRGT